MTMGILNLLVTMFQFSSPYSIIKEEYGTPKNNTVITD